MNGPDSCNRRSIANAQLRQRDTVGAPVLTQQAGFYKLRPSYGAPTCGLSPNNRPVTEIPVDASIEPPMQRRLRYRQRRAASVSENIARSRTVVLITRSLASWVVIEVHHRARTALCLSTLAPSSVIRIRSIRIAELQVNVADRPAPITPRAPDRALPAGPRGAPSRLYGRSR